MKHTFNRNRKKFFLIPFGIAALLALVSYIVMELWNNLLPELLHVSTITFWQAMGIFILCKILFGFSKGGGAPWAGHKMADRFKGMTPEERQQFRSQMRDKMCNWKSHDPKETT
ncbi:Asp23/Gls24 family envelope stress response protein [Pedobacter metabolipauper]|uniref:Uncharacterized protein n=1 Tax=Pedobacter metabolipauper TaxID=425513 RepID=A0A4R6T0C4_9SPHI|nr:hypothetical protein [Pedobacter metabolipauper]TDQ11852.1 hypothetical protein ATK78_0982 [Pedobacter metabolipauper]